MIINSRSVLSESLLYKATAAWLSLTDYSYEFIYGFREKLHTIHLTFAVEEYHHLAGFQYLNDLAIPRYNPEKLITNILNGALTQSQIEKGIQYTSMVEPRLRALSYLESILNDPFTLYSYHPEKYAFLRTSIIADYIISSEYNGISYVFLFGGDQKAQIHDCFCRSIFMKTDRDYTSNQRAYSLLMKSRTRISTNEKETIFIKEGFDPDQNLSKSD